MFKMLIKVKIKSKTNSLFLKHYQKKINLNYNTQKEIISISNLKLTTFIIFRTNQNETQSTFRTLKNLILNITKTLIMCQLT